MGLLAASAIHEALAYCCTRTARNMQAQNMNCSILDNHGNEKQKKEWLQDMCKFNILSSFCYIEPGQDPIKMETKARSQGDEYVLSGNKVYLGAAKASHILFVFANTSASELSLLGVPTDAKGISFPNDNQKLGFKIVNFDNVRLPK